MKFFLVVIALAVTNAIPQNHREINRESPQKDRQIYIIDPQIPQHQINPISARYPGFVAERPLLPRLEPQVLVYSSGPGQPILLQPGEVPGNFLFPQSGPGIVFRDNPGILYGQQPQRPVFVAGYPKPAHIPKIDADAEEVPTNPAEIPPFRPEEDKKGKKPEKLETFNEPNSINRSHEEDLEEADKHLNTNARKPFPTLPPLKPGQRFFILNGQPLFSNYPLSDLPSPIYQERKEFPQYEKRIPQQNQPNIIQDPSFLQRGHHQEFLGHLQKTQFFPEVVRQFKNNGEKKEKHSRDSEKENIQESIQNLFTRNTVTGQISDVSKDFEQNTGSVKNHDNEPQVVQRQISNPQHLLGEGSGRSEPTQGFLTQPELDQSQPQPGFLLHQPNLLRSNVPQPFLGQPIFGQRIVGQRQDYQPQFTSKQKVLDNSQQQKFNKPQQQVVNNPTQQILNNPQEQIFRNSQQQILRNVQQQIQGKPQQEILRSFQQQISNNPQGQFLVVPQQQILENPQQQIFENPQHHILNYPQQEIIRNPQQQIFDSSQPIQLSVPQTLVAYNNEAQDIKVLRSTPPLTFIALQSPNEPTNYVTPQVPLQSRFEEQEIQQPTLVTKPNVGDYNRYQGSKKQEEEENNADNDDDEDSIVVDAKAQDVIKLEDDEDKDEVANDSSTEKLAEPSIAQAQPGGIALAGPGGTAASGPRGTALVGPGGLAVSSPRATAVAGPRDDESKKKDKNEKKEN